MKRTPVIYFYIWRKVIKNSPTACEVGEAGKFENPKLLSSATFGKQTIRI
jgi:hypothetical protein